MLPRKNSLMLLPLFLLVDCGGSATGPGNEAATDLSAPPPKEVSEDSADSTAADSTAADSTAVVKYQGIDISHFENTIDWTAVRSTGKKFAFVKATEGIDLPDPQFASNWQGAKAAGLVRGAYHFYVPEDDATTQAEFFIANVHLAAGDLAPVLDVESSLNVDAATLEANIKIWLETVEKAYGITPIIYTDVNFAKQFLSSGFERYPLWIAEFGETEPTVEGSWTSWDFWQYSDSGEVDGIDVAVDLDVFQGTVAQWQELVVRADPEG